MITLTTIIFVICCVVTVTGFRARAGGLRRRDWTESDDSVLASFVVGSILSGIALAIELFP